MKRPLWIFLGLLCLTFTDLTQAGAVTWRKTPIPIDLVVGVEQMIVLPANGAVGLPPVLANSNYFKTLVTGGTAYWTALEAFEHQRIKVRLESGEYILFDVSARVEKAPPANVETIQVLLPSTQKDISHQGADQNPSGAQPLFELIRYAAQETYSPARLVAALDGVRSVPVGLYGNLAALYDQGQHTGLVLQPQKAWSTQGLYVTSFVVTNEHSHAMVLDNRKVQHVANEKRSGVAPHFLASVFFDGELAPRGHSGNQTTLFIVTNKPIRSVLRGL